MKKEITVHCIAQSRVNREEMQSWLHDVGAHEFAKSLNPTIAELDEILQGGGNGPTDADLIVGTAAKRCYNSFEVGLNPNVTKIRKDWTEYLDNVLKSGHGSVTEHATWTWAFEGVTRVFTGEMNRHRAGVAISEASLRYIRFDSREGIPYWEPLSIRESDADDGETHAKKLATRAIFSDAFACALDAYRKLEGAWADELNATGPDAFTRKKQLTSMFRRIVPLGVSVGAVYTLNMRALRHIMTMRCDPAAEEEIAYAMGLVAKQMCESEPRLLGDFEEVGGFWKPKYRKV